MKKALIILLTSLLLMGAVQDSKVNLDEVRGRLLGRSDMEQIILLGVLIEKYPTSIELMLLKSGLEYKNKDYRGAERTLFAALKIKNDHEEVLRLAGLVAFQLQKWSDAKTYFDRVLVLNKNDSIAKLNLSLMSVGYTDTKIVKTAEYEKYDIEELDRLYGITTETNDSFQYLLNKKSINIIDQYNYEYTIHIIVKLLNKQSAEYFRNFSQPYNSHYFTPGIVVAGSHSPDFKYKSVDERNITITDSPSSDDSLAFSSIKNIKFPVPDLKVGGYFEYRISFNPNNSNRVKKFFDRHLFSSAVNTGRSEYMITIPENLPLKYEIYGQGVVSSEKSEDGSKTITAVAENPAVYRLKDERITLSELSASIYCTLYDNWDNALSEYYSKIDSTLSDLEYKKIISVLSLQPDFTDKTKLEVVENFYTYIQKNIHYISISLADGALIPRSPDTVLRNKFGDCKDQSVLLAELLTRSGIKAYPMLISTFENGSLKEEIPSIGYFDHMIVYIPIQSGFDRELFLDTTTGTTTLGNIPSSVQGMTGVAYIDSAARFIKVPEVGYSENFITEIFDMVINPVGGGVLNYIYDLKGVFSEIIRNSHGSMSEEQLFLSYYDTQKKTFPELKKDDLKVEGLGRVSGPIKIQLTTDAKDVTSLFYDGKQKVTFSLKDLNSFFNIPQLRNYDYNMRYLHGYKKILRYKFPEGYEVIEGNIKNIKKENNYIFFEFNSERLSDNEIRVTFDFHLKKRLIEKNDFENINRFFSVINNEINFYLTFENTKNFNYDEFYRELVKVYQNTDVYENWIRRLIEDGNLDRVIEVCNEGSELFKDNDYFYLIKASVLIEQFKYKDAEELLLGMLGSETSNVNIYMYLVDIYKKTQDEESLERLLQRAVEKFPSNKSIISELSMKYVRSQQYKKGIDFLEKVLKSMPNDADINHDMAYMYSLVPDYGKAEEFYKKALAISPKNATFLNNLAWLYCENDTNIEQAIKLAKMACEIQPLNDAFLDTLAEAYFKNKEYDLAIEIIKRAMKINPNYTYLQQQLNRIEQARQKGLKAE